MHVEVVKVKPSHVARICHLGVANPASLPSCCLLLATGRFQPFMAALLLTDAADDCLSSWILISGAAPHCCHTSSSQHHVTQ
jgi:hypothetical protein